MALPAGALSPPHTLDQAGNVGQVGRPDPGDVPASVSVVATSAPARPECGRLELSGHRQNWTQFEVDEKGVGRIGAGLWGPTVA